MKSKLNNLAAKLGIDITLFQSTTSTNDVASDGEHSHGDVVIAEYQSAGRGQKGHQWESEKGKNLTFSVVLEPHFLAASEQFLLSMAVSLSVVDMLRSYGIEAQIKWSNDIYIEGRKVAGMLIENEICGNNLSRSVVGLGLNVNQTLFDSTLPNPTSMLIASGMSKDFDRDEVLERFLDALRIRYTSLADNNIQQIQSDYHAHLYLLNTLHTYTLPDGSSFTGIIRRVEPSGELVVEHPDKSLTAYLFTEIALATPS